MAPPATDFARSDPSRLDTFSWDEQFARYRCPSCRESVMLVTAHVGYWLAVLETVTELENAVEGHMKEDLARHRGRCPCGRMLERGDCETLWYCSFVPSLEGDLQIELDPLQNPPRVRRYTLLKTGGARTDWGGALPPEAAAAVYEGETWTDDMRLGISYFMQSQSASAIESFVAATKKDPAHYRGFAWLGRAREQAEDDAGAESAYREAVTLGHPDAEVRFGLAQAVMAQGRTTEAAGLYREALAMGLDAQPAALAHANLGIALSEEGKIDEAAREWNAAVERDDQCAIAQFNLGVYHERNGRLDEAGACFEAYLDAAPDADDADELRGHVDELKQRGRPA